MIDQQIANIPVDQRPLVTSVPAPVTNQPASTDLQKLQGLIAQGYYPIGFSSSALSPNATSPTLQVTLEKGGSTTSQSSSQPDFIQYANSLREAIMNGRKV